MYLRQDIELGIVRRESIAVGMALFYLAIVSRWLGEDLRSTQVDRVHPFVVGTAEANHTFDTRVESVQIWVCDACHGVAVSLTDGSVRLVTRNGEGGTFQTVSQGQEWGATVAGMFGGKHGSAFTDPLGQTSEAYTN